MHAIFMPYGKRSEVELLLRDMDAQKHKLILTRGKKKKEIWIQGQVRLLPFGIYEYVFPKEDIDVVLQTLDFKASDKFYGFGDLKLKLMRMILNFIKCKKIPKFKEDKHYLWVKTHINIFPLGIRYDREMTDPDGENKGWTHEAI